MENPAVLLAPIVTRLFELAGNTDIPNKTRNDAYFYASKLRGYMVNLISKQFDDETPQYKDAMQQLKSVNAKLEAAAKDIKKIVEAVKGLAALAAALDKLLKVVAAVI